MKKIKTAFLFFCISLFCFSILNSHSQQKRDSLTIYYKLSKNKNKTINFRLIYINKLIKIAKKQENEKYILKGFNQKSYLFSKQKKYDSAIVWANLLLKKSIRIKNTSKTKLAYKKLADYNRLNNNLLQSLSFYKKHKKINIEHKDTLAIIKDLRYITSIQKTLGASFESEISVVEALKLTEQLKINDHTIKIKMSLYNHLGILYSERYDYNKALKLYDKALFTAIKPNNIIILINNKATIYLEQKEFELAILEFQKIYNSSLALNDKKQIAIALGNLGLAQSKLNKPEGLTNLLKSLSLRKTENNSTGLFASNIHLAEYYTDKNIKNKALFYANKAYKLAEILDNDKYKIKALSYLVDLNDNPKIVTYKKLTDSINKAQQVNTNKYASLKYDYTEKEKIATASELKAKNSKIKQVKERFYKLIFLATGIFFLLIAVFTYFILKAKNKKQKLEQVYITETRISQKVHDEVANDLYGVMIKLQQDEPENTKILDDLERVYFKTRDISKENSIINFTEDFNIILQDLLISYKNNDVNVITRNLHKIEWKSVSELKKTAIYRVLQELMTNMKKHSKATITVLSFSEKNKKITINYNDNGIGCLLNKNTGLQNTETRINSVNGNITFDSQTNKGFKVKITV